MTTTKAYLDQFTSFASNGGGAGPSWLLPVRSRALDRFAQLGFPTPKNEDWHFTSVAPISERAFRSLHDSEAQLDPRALQPHLFGHPEWTQVVFVNGRFSPALSRLQPIAEGVRIRDLATAAVEDDPLVARHLTRVASYDQHTFTALNTAFMYDGAVIEIAKDVVATTPIHVIHVADEHAAGGVSHPRHLIVAHDNARATVLESYVSTTGEVYFTNAVTEVVVGDGATVEHYRIQREGLAAFHVGTVEAHQGRNSHFVSFSFATGGALSRTNIYTALEGEGCGATLNGLYMLDGTQHCDHQTRIEHVAPNCFSREVYKGIMDGRSHGVFNGKVYVHPAAQKTDGKQSNNNLLLSHAARVDTKPQLEIFADDVKCTHGATVGRLDENALYYMKSRGLSPHLARTLLTYAFAADVIETIELEPLKEELERWAMDRFVAP